jgi:hypothetical protein
MTAADGRSTSFFAAVPVAAFALWAFRPDVSLPLVAVAVIVPVVAAQRFGQLEPLFFEVSCSRRAIAWRGASGAFFFSKPRTCVGRRGQQRLGGP